MNKLVSDPNSLQNRDKSLSRFRITNCTTEYVRLLQYCIIILMLPVMPLILNSCGSNEVKPNTASLTSSDDLPTQTSAHTRMAFSSDGKIRAVMNATGVRVFEQRRYTLLDTSVRVDFFDRESNHSSVLTSRRAFIDDNTKNMTAYDSVQVRSDSGTVVETDSLLWDNLLHRLHSDAFVKISEKSGRTTRGHGFESDQDLINYKILYPLIDAPSTTFENMNGSPAFSSPGSPSNPLNGPQPFSLPQAEKPGATKQDSAH